MVIFSYLSLRQWLTLPYIVLIFCVAALIGALSYRTGSEAVDTVANHLLGETVARMGQAVDRHIVGSAAALEAAFPNGMAAPESVVDDLAAMRTRFWIATSLHIDPNNYVYYGNRLGQFFGLWRFDLDNAELRLRQRSGEFRRLYRYTGINGRLSAPTVEEKMFEPRLRPWFQAGETSAASTWTAIYIDFRNDELIVTRARRVLDGRGDFAGVVATDVSLKRLNEFVRSLDLSTNAVAFIIEQDGNLIASSRTPNIAMSEDGSGARISAGQSEHALQRVAYAEVARALAAGEPIGSPVTARFAGPDGEPVEVAYNRVRDDAGLDWIIVVAMPRSDFMHGVVASVQRTALIGLAGALIAALIGFGIVNWVSGDLRRLTAVAREVGEGELDTPLDIQRRDEIGVLASTLRKMRRQLQTDVLTGLYNRSEIERMLSRRVSATQRATDARPFAVLFADLDRFKRINDEFGHDIGDRVLIEMAGRLRAAVRAEDRVARYAGDEFVLLVEDVASREIAERIRANVEAALELPLAELPAENAWSYGGSVGLAWFPADGDSADQLIKASDDDMYARKEARRKAREA